MVLIPVAGKALGLSLSTLLRCSRSWLVQLPRSWSWPRTRCCAAARLQQQNTLFDTNNRSEITHHRLHVQVFSGLLIGAMLPYWFSSMTMKSVGKAALAMVDEVRHQFNTIAGLMEGTARPDYKRCVEISTKVRHWQPTAPVCITEIFRACRRPHQVMVIVSDSRSDVHQHSAADECHKPWLTAQHGGFATSTR